jgi:hypothetical protein
MDENKEEPLSDKWAIIPVGGADKISTFVSLLGGSKLNIAAFIDIAAKDQQRIESLVKNKLLKKGNLFTVGTVIGQGEGDVEDMFEEEEYLKVVSEAYKSELSGKPIKSTDLNSKIPRITKRIDSYFKDKGIANGKFNHFRPADALLKNPKLEPGLYSKNTIQNFKKLFELINKVVK